jgi:hypothetical protein
MTTLLLLLRGIVVGLPTHIETFEIGDRLSPLTPTQITSTVKIIRNNQSKIDVILNMVEDEIIRNKAQDELEDLLLTQDFPSKKTSESIIRSYIQEILKENLS